MQVARFGGSRGAYRLRAPVVVLMLGQHEPDAILHNVLLVPASAPRGIGVRRL